MSEGGTVTSSGNLPIYSIQRTYIITPHNYAGKEILTCDQRIDIPTIEPLPQMQAVVYQEQHRTVVPCIELTGVFLAEFNLTFETNEGVTVLPIKIASGQEDPLENPYTHVRCVLVFPRGTTGVKSCKLIERSTGIEVQHNFTFGIMPPPYNYDNALFGYLSAQTEDNERAIIDINTQLKDLKNKTDSLKVVTGALKTSFPRKELPKASGKQTINIEKGMLYFWAQYTYYTSEKPATHTPKITVSDGITSTVCILSLRAPSQTVMIDLLAGTVIAANAKTGEIYEQRKIQPTIVGYKTIEFENFDDIMSSTLTVLITGRGVE